jgi:hypothetical protein
VGLVLGVVLLLVVAGVSWLVSRGFANETKEPAVAAVDPAGARPGVPPPALVNGGRPAPGPAALPAPAAAGVPGVDVVDLDAVDVMRPELPYGPGRGNSPYQPGGVRPKAVATVQPSAVPWAGRPDPAPAVAAAAATAGEQKVAIPPRNVVFAAGRPLLLVAGGKSGEAPAVWDLASGKKLGEFSKAAPIDRLTRLSPDGGRIACYDSGGAAGTIDVWEAGGDRPAARLKPAGGVFWFDFMPDSRRLAAHCIGTEDQRLQVWDVTGGRAISDAALPANLFPHPGTAAKANPRTGRGRSRPGDPPSPVMPPRNPKPDPYAGAVSPGGRYVALSTSGRFVLVSVADCQVAGDLPWQDGQWRVRAAQFSADGLEFQAILYLPKTGMHGREEPAQGGRLHCWEMEKGTSVVDVTLSTPLAAGPILTGPDAGSLVVSGNYDWALPAPGSLQATPESAGMVVDRGTGAVLAKLPFCPVARLTDGRLAGYEPNRVVADKYGHFVVDDKAGRFAVCTKPDPASLAGPADEARAELQGLPPAKDGDRSAVRAVEPQPPAAWSVPARAAVAPGALVASVPVPAPGVLLVAANRAAVVTQSRHEQPKAHLNTEVTYLDLQKGTAGGETLVLRTILENAAPNGPQVQKGAGPYFGDLSPSGAIVLRDPDDPRRVDARDGSGKWIAGLRPYNQILDWAGWSADGKLLTLGGGQLTAWELPSCKAVYEMNCGRDAKVIMTPDHTLAVVATAGRLDVLDAATGECRGRLDAPGQLLSLALSADGQHLAALFAARRGAGLRPGWREVRAWSLADGRSEGVAPVAALNSRLQWAGPRQVLVGGVSLVDLEVGWATALLQAPAGRMPLAVSPDDRLWYLVTETLPQGTDRQSIRDRALRIAQGKPADLTGPTRLVAATRPPPAGGELVFGPKVPLRLEVEFDGPSHKAAAVAAWTACARDMGFTVGDGGWTLKMSAREQETNTTMDFGPGGSLLQVRVPMVSGKAELVAPDGTVVQTSSFTQRFPGRASKYFKKKQDVVVGPNGRWIELYDFRGQDPKTAMADEVWERYVIDARFYGACVWKAGGKYEVLPRQEALTLP